MSRGTVRRFVCIIITIVFVVFYFITDLSCRIIRLIITVNFRNIGTHQESKQKQKTKDIFKRKVNTFSTQTVGEFFFPYPVSSYRFSKDLLSLEKFVWQNFWHPCMTIISV